MADLSVALRAHQALVESVKAAYPEETEESLADSIDSIAELDQAIVAVLRQAIEREMLGAALAERIKEMQTRKKRLEDGAATLRHAVLETMLAVRWKRLPVPPPDLTVTVGDGTPKLLITDESALPFDLVEIATKPNRAAIKEALKAGREVAGAMFGNAEPHLIVSRR